jgi:hypothetical protein
MTKFITFALVLGILFLGLESSADIGDQHPHGDTSIHALELPDAVDGGDDQSKSPHCQHCCHAHTIGLSGEIDLAGHELANKLKLPGSIEFTNSPQAPPTPPPNV